MRIVVIVILVLAALAAAPAAQPRVSASDAWIAAPAAAATSTAAFAVVHNPTMYDVYLVSAQSEAAGAVQFRQAAAGGEATPIKEITVPAYEKLEMSPKSVHLWLSDLKRPLKAGDSIAIVLFTDDGTALQVTAAVR
jgi:copper(I)-binding protein